MNIKRTIQALALTTFIASNVFAKGKAPNFVDLEAICKQPRTVEEMQSPDFFKANNTIEYFPPFGDERWMFELAMMNYAYDLGYNVMIIPQSSEPVVNGKHSIPDYLVSHRNKISEAIDGLMAHQIINAHQAFDFLHQVYHPEQVGVFGMSMGSIRVLTCYHFVHSTPGCEKADMPYYIVFHGSLQKVIPHSVETKDIVERLGISADSLEAELSNMQLDFMNLDVINMVRSKVGMVLRKQFELAPKASFWNPHYHPVYPNPPNLIVEKIAPPFLEGWIRYPTIFGERLYYLDWQLNQNQ